MGLHLTINFPIKPQKIISPEFKILLVGSCFSENIGSQLTNSGFDVHINPFGILYNPASIAHSLHKIMALENYSQDDLMQNQEGRFVSLDHHGKYSGKDSELVLESINQSILSAHNFLKKTNLLIITLGSSWVYKYNKTNKIVANCHKIPNTEFHKVMLSSSEIESQLQKLEKALLSFNSDLNILYTISPVKHLRDGVIENQRSKSALILAVQNRMELNHKQILYFPAYEIVNDELRDYRFYEEDFAHPNHQAIQYIWLRFMETCFTDKAKEMASEAKKIEKNLNHRSLHGEQNDIISLRKRIDNFNKKFPN